MDKNLNSFYDFELDFLRVNEEIEICMILKTVNQHFSKQNCCFIFMIVINWGFKNVFTIVILYK